MFSIAEWQQDDFLNRDNYKTLHQQVADFLFYNMEWEAYNLFNELNKKSDLINNINDEKLKDDYAKDIQILKFISLPWLNDDTVLEIFREELVVMLNFDQEELNVKDKIRKKLVNILLADRDKYKEQLVKCLEENEQIITQGKLEIAGEQKEGRVNNWIKEYYKFIVENNIDRKLIKAEFLFKNKNVARLKDEDKQKLEIVLDLYDNWHKSSLTVAGNEDPMVVSYGGKTYLVYNGEISEIGAKDNPVDANRVKAQLDKTILANRSNIEKEKDEVLLEENIKNNNLDNNIEHKNGKEELQVKWQNFLKNWLMVEVMEKIEKNSSKDVYEMKDMRSQFYHAVNKHDAKDALVSLLVIAEHGHIKQAFGDDERYQKFWGSYLESTFAKATEDERNNLDDGQFKDNLAQVKYLAMFFKYIMEERLKLDQDQAVMIGVMLANLCRQAQEIEYQQMAYGDIESGEFRWNI